MLTVKLSKCCSQILSKNAKQEEIAVDNCKLLDTFVMKDYYNNYRSKAKVIRRTITENTIIFQFNSFAFIEVPVINNYY